MDCSQILPGAVNPGPCSLATGYFQDTPFIVYASGTDVVMLDGRLRHLQTVLGSDCGYGDARINCVHCAESVGKIAVAWGSDVVVFEPEPLDESFSSSNEFPGEWRSSQTLTLAYPLLSLCWNKDGSQLLTGGQAIVLWGYERLEGKVEPAFLGGQDTREKESELSGFWSELWQCHMALPITHLKFSPDGAMFASISENDCLVKIWYAAKDSLSGIGRGQHPHSFVYVAHPRAVTGFAWRNTSTFLPRGSMANVLLTYCKDNICRLWSHSLSMERKKRLRFFIAASIDPLADIPFRSTPPIEDLPFVVHWLNNKETTLTSKAEKTQRGAFHPVSRHSSLASFASSINEEMLQSWVCIDDSLSPEDHSSDPQSSDATGSSSLRKQAHAYSFSNFLSLSAQAQQQRSATRGGSVSPGGGAHVDGKMSISMKFFAQLMDEWCNSPDLLFCIHPSTGSLMVWTVEGLDAPLNSTRLVHISFSSCLPHIFPPHQAQSLKYELLQFLIKEPDVVQTREIATASGSITEISLPVPQIKLPSGGSMSNLQKEDLPRTKPDSTLILVSSHLNGSLNTWSVELTVQSSYYTSIAGLIHCGGTGGHHSEVKAVHRHPWLPVLMTVSSDVGSEKKVNGVENELIVWNADLPGTLENKSKLNELSRMSSPNPLSFRHVTWLPPISVSGSAEGAFARCPSSGLFIANVGSELRLYQTSLYCITRPQPTSYMQDVASLAKKGAAVASASTTPLEPSQQEVTVTSHLGKEGISLLSVIEKDLSAFDEIVSLHAFRMCSLVTTFDIKRSLDSKFCRDIVIALVENQALSSSSPGSKSARSYLHLWRVVVSRKTPVAGNPQTWSTSAPGPSSQMYSLSLQPEVYSASVEKVYFAALPLPSGTYVIHSSPDCDRASSLQLQLPTLSAPFLFTTACSDGTIRCWQFKVKSPGGIPLSPTTADGPENTEEQTDDLRFELYEVFGASTSQEADTATQASKGLDCYKEKVLNDLPIISYVPLALTSSYPGRFAMAHQLSKSATPTPTSPLKSTSNPLGQYTAVTVWECESSGGLEWSCEATLMLSGLRMVTSKSKTSSMSTLLEWLPMENGAYLLATCFASIISIFGMALPQAKDQYTTVSSSRMSSFLPMQKSAAVLSGKKSRASWVCLLQFPCAKPYPGLSISCFSYTGSNSLLLSIGSEMHLYSCWVKGSKLEAFTPSKEERKLVSKTPSRVFRKPTPGEASSKLTDADIINMLDYAHARNTPLPQYHPNVLMELMNSGKLNAVKTVLVNVVKYLLLYKERKKQKSYFDEQHDYDDKAEEEEGGRVRFLSMSSDGYLKRSKKAKPKVNVESIPPLSLSKLGIFNERDSVDQQRREDDEGEGTTQGEDDYDELFSTTLTPPKEDFTYGFEEAESKILTFLDLNPDTSDFTPQLAEELSTILQYAQLADLSDLEQVRLLAIAETVANTKTSFSDQTGFQASVSARVDYTYASTLEFASSSGAGYASSGLTHGVRGGEAMDDCGLRYLLALENYVTLSESLPKDVRPGSLMPCDLTWAFHSDAELELLAAIRCVQKDELSWAELRNAGVGWWLRSSDTLRRLIEKLAKTQFMHKQDPLDASLFYMAMKKKSLVKGLFKTVGDTRMMTFFGNDFTQERWRKAALKNAFALLGKQRFEHAAAFFLLADKLWDAVEVCVSRLGDLQLAFVIVRLYEGDGGPVYGRLLKECILGIGISGSTSLTRRLETNPDPFLRSIACWLLQDYSGALETLLVTPETVVRGKASVRSSQGMESDNSTGHIPDPAIFNFYFFLRSHPLLLRRDYRLRGSKSLFQSQPHSSSSPLTGVGDEPFTPAERSLLFSTAYHHLSHGCPLLALDVLSKLPKSCNLGVEVCSTCSKEPPAATGRGGGFKSAKHVAVTETESITGMIQSGTLTNSFAFGDEGSPTKPAADNIDWSQPVSSQIGSSDDFDWNQPITSQLGNRTEPEDEFDWSKPVSSQISLTGNLGDEGEEDIDWSQPVLKLVAMKEEERESLGSEEGGHSKSTFSTQGLFILSLAEQLQYNACLSILTEELNTIFIPACCRYLWVQKGKDALPLFPLARKADDNNLAMQYRENAFEKTVLSLRGMLVEWLRSETKIVKEICGFDMVEQDLDDIPENYTPAGYDLLTTLMNYVALHAATTPTLLTIKLELMHLVNTLLPWSTGLSQVVQDFEIEGMPSGPTCAVDPAQLPILTSCSLPAKHLTNLAVHLRMMSASIVEILATHTCPPIASKPLPHVREVFDLCCAISHCVTICLSPMRLAEMAGGTIAMATANQSQTSVQGEQQKTPQMFRRVPSGGTPPTRPRSGSGLTSLDFLQSIDTPNTKPSKWPGVAQWPSSLSSHEGKDPTPLSLILVECCVAVYLGLLSVAWSWHSISDLQLLVENAPSQEMWYSTFGGGVEVKKADERGKRSGSQSRSIFMQTVDAMTKRFKTLRRSSVDVQEVDDTGIGLFIAPKRTLLDHYLAAPPHSKVEEEDIFTPDGNDSDLEEEPDQYHMEQGPFFRLGSISTEDRERDHDNSDSFPWCLMNLCITKLVQNAIRKVLSTAGLEVVELVTLSPLLYSTLKILDEWESIFTRRLDALGGAPDDLFPNEEEEESIMFKVGPALMRHKFILEPDNSPFRLNSKAAQQAKQLWKYLVHQDEVRETFIHYIFTNKRVGSVEDARPERRILYKDADIVSTFCINSSNPSMLAVAIAREVLEIDAPDNSAFDFVPLDDSSDSIVPTRRSHSVAAGMTEDYVMIQSSPFIHRVPSLTSQQFHHPLTMHAQMGGTSSMLLKRNAPGVKHMATHPSLAYYLTGSFDGSVMMWEFGTPRPVSIQRAPGSGSSVTKIRFTPQGNKYGMTDISGKLYLWQGIHTSTKIPYKTLDSGMKCLNDFLFLGSSSFIATCGDASDNTNLLLWDTLLPPKRSIVREYMCHEGGATTLGYSRSKQRLYCGGKKGEICIFDIRQYALLQCFPLHTAAVNCIAVNDVDGYLVTGSADGDIKVLDLTSMNEVASFAGEHAKSRLFRSEAGVTNVCISPGGRLYSCGADGTIKCRTMHGFL